MAVVRIEQAQPVEGNPCAWRSWGRGVWVERCPVEGRRASMGQRTGDADGCSQGCLGAIE